MGMITKNKRGESGTLVAIKRMIRAPREKRNVTNSLVTVAIVKIYFGTNTFFKRPAFPRTEVSDCEMAPDMKLKSNCPIKR